MTTGERPVLLGWRNYRAAIATGPACQLPIRNFPTLKVIAVSKRERHAAREVRDLGEEWA
jgi:hypothetical protein